MEFEVFLGSNLPPPARFLFSEGAARLLGAELTAPAGALLCIGPEGGWDPHEVDAAAAAGFEAFSLGPSILRSETAAIAAAALFLLRTAETGERRI
jgi:16S rRNA (uracil1498-N3)-methyltransferase